MITGAIAGALAHSLWQGVLAFAVVLVLDAAVARDRATARHAVRVLVLACWLVAFLAQALGQAGAPATSVATVVHEAGLPAWLSAAWLCGVSIGALRVVVGAVRLSAWRRAARPVGARTQAMADAIACEIGVRAVRVAEHAAVAVPCVVGVLVPIVLLPVGLAAALPPSVLRTVLVHELVHLRRFDPWINALVVLATVLLFHHPVVWWLAREIRAEREHACDAVSAPLCGGALHYARALVDLAASRSWVSGRPVGIPVIAGEGLRARVARLLPGASPSSRRRTRGWWIGAVLVVLGLALVPAAPPAADDRAELSIAWLPASVRRHEAEIVAAATRHGIDPELLAIVVLVESGGDPGATSPVGARGLMQIMPRTAAEISEHRRDPGAAADLYDPRTSLDLGADYLAQQLRAFSDLQEQRRIELAAAAYNGGPARAKAWQRGGALPRETERYRRLVGALWRERHMPTSPTLSRRDAG